MWRALKGARFIRMDGQTQRIQLVSADNSMALGHRIQVMPWHGLPFIRTNETGNSKNMDTPPPFSPKWREWQCWRLFSSKRCRVHFLFISHSEVTRRACCSSPPQHQKKEVWWSLVWGLTHFVKEHFWLCGRKVKPLWCHLMFLCYFNITKDVSKHIFSLLTN